MYADVVPVPLYNLMVSILTLVFIKTSITLCHFLVDQNCISLLASRKIVHITASCMALFWPLYDEESDGWSHKFNVLPGVIFFGKFLWQGLVFPDPNDPEVKTLTRTGDPKELLVGPLMFASVLINAGYFCFKQEVATFLLASIGFGDGIAPVVGRTWLYGRYVSILGGETKTVSGSLGMFLGTIFGCFVFQAVLGAPETFDMSRVVGVAATATLAEAVSGRYDNLAIALAVYFYVNATKQ